MIPYLSKLNLNNAPLSSLEGSFMDVKQFSSDKILKHLDKVNDWLWGKNPFAITIEFDLTNVCNSNCRDCAGGRVDKAASISLEDGKRIIRELKELGARGLTFTGGGEPLCNSAITALVKYAYELGLDIGVITNGILLTEEICQILVNSCVWIRISLDAGDSEMYKQTHGLGKEVFDKVLGNIARLVKTKKDFNSKIILGAGYLTGPETISGILDFVKLSKELGVDYAQFRPYHRSKYDPKIEEAVNKAEKLATKDFDVLTSKHKYECMKQSDYGRDYKVCYGHQFATVIGADMKMYLCCHMRGMEKFCFGDLNKNSIKELWNSEQRKKAIKNINLNNLQECVPLCRCNTFNQVLWNIKQSREHQNFL